MPAFRKQPSGNSTVLRNVAIRCVNGFTALPSALYP
jgi:hypothetical protein